MLKTPSYDVLRRASISFDIALALAFSLRFQNLLSSGVPFLLFVYMDSSPPWSGRAPFAARFDLVRLVDGERLCSRHHLPLINWIRRTDRRTARRGRFFGCWCWCVEDNTTCYGRSLRDSATSPQISARSFWGRDVGDFLIPFMRCIGARVPVAARQQRFLFPFALAAAGWHHIMDALLRFGLLTQNWFGGFLDLVKALTRWLRVATDDIMDTLNAAGKSGAAALVGALTLKSFAQWRWKTLESVMRSLKSCVVALRLHRDCLLPLLDRSKDTVWAAQVRKGLMEPKLMMRFEFVDWFA